ncbi:MAG: transcription antitermination factor NusB [Bryobacteraceae bacterium]
MIAIARTVAFDILMAVEKGGYASDLLLTRTSDLDSRDAGLAEEIVFGVLRYRGSLDYLIRHYSGRPAGRSAQRLDAEVATALRIGIYQLRYLERIPAHAAVGESVELIKRARKRSAAGFANAVLRKVDRDPIEWPDNATRLSHPAWLLDRWSRMFGAAQAEAIALANLAAPIPYERDGRIQDIGSQSIVPLLQLAPGQTFLDLCAAPGNKTAQALETRIEAVACDLHPRRLRALKTLGIPLIALDGTRPLPFARKFDRILLDVPCSGTGTLARNPEIKWKLNPGDLSDLQARQIALLDNALDVLAPGGLLVYSTCSLESEENEEVVAKVAANRSANCAIEVLATMRRLPGRDPGDGFFAAVIKFL